MALIGIIRRESALSLDEWLRVVSETDELVPRPTTIMENIFRGDIEFRPPGPGEVSIVIGGKGVGAISPSQDFEETGELDVWGPDAQHSEIRALAEGIATKLHAQVEWDE